MYKFNGYAVSEGSSSRRFKGLHGTSIWSLDTKRPKKKKKTDAIQNVIDGV